MRQAKDIIGEAALADLLKDYDVTPKPAPPEPKRLVTMEESRERYEMGASRGAAHGLVGHTNFMAAKPYQREAIHAADDWLVRTVNRRIIEGLPPYNTSGWVLTDQTGSTRAAFRPDLLRLFCGEEP